MNAESRPPLIHEERAEQARPRWEETHLTPIDLIPSRRRYHEPAPKTSEPPEPPPNAWRNEPHPPPVVVFPLDRQTDRQAPIPLIVPVVLGVVLVVLVMALGILWVL